MPAMCDHAADGSGKGDTTIDDGIVQDRSTWTLGCGALSEKMYPCHGKNSLILKQRKKTRKIHTHTHTHKQLKKNVDNASTLGVELDKALGDTATASALQRTTMIEIRDLNECATKGEIAKELSTLLSAPHLNRDVVKTLRKAYAGTQVAVAALPDDLAAKALKLGHVRIGWVNCRIRGREDTLRCYRCGAPPTCVFARSKALSTTMRSQASTAP
ncbi:unnamed protein product [Trichogramma brassicae]|uniref:Uncharacterized protein n=1 Tax=Trichogramma brassicae TaxID=86971 RepID=A0A6H5J2B5_9HYME|nr:unnamed protein product [Trichogramma brassicae]